MADLPILKKKPLSGLQGYLAFRAQLGCWGWGPPAEGAPLSPMIKATGGVSDLWSWAQHTQNEGAVSGVPHHVTLNSFIGTLQESPKSGNMDFRVIYAGLPYFFVLGSKDVPTFWLLL